jgi:hypothetical protein
MKKRTSWGHLSFAKIIAGLMEFFGVRMLVGLVLAAGALIFFGWLASEIFEGETKIFDEAVRAAAMQTASPRLTQLMVFFSFIGSVVFLFPLGIVAVIIFLRLKWKRAAEKSFQRQIENDLASHRQGKQNRRAFPFQTQKNDDGDYSERKEKDHGTDKREKNHQLRQLRRSGLHCRGSNRFVKDFCFALENLAREPAEKN